MHKYPFEGARKHQRTSIGELQNQEREKKKKNKLPERLTVGQIALGHGGGSTVGAWHFRVITGSSVEPKMASGPATTVGPRCSEWLKRVNVRLHEL
jgi:hypothetical protein